MSQKESTHDILVVEDRSLEREHLVSLFEKEDYSTLSTNTLEDTSSILERHLFRLCILDLGLGDGAGSAVYDLVKNSEKVDYILVLTGNPSIHLKKRFLEAGAAAYIVKGSEEAASAELKTLVQSLIGRPLSLI